VRVQLQFRGREMAHQELACSSCTKFAMISRNVAGGNGAKIAGRNITMTLAPLPGEPPEKAIYRPTTKRSGRAGNPLFHRRKVERLNDYLAPSASATIVSEKSIDLCVERSGTVAAATLNALANRKCARCR